LRLLPFVLTLAAPAPAGDAPPDDAAHRFRDEIQPFARKYCTECHGERRQRADINLQSYEDPTSVTRDRKVWERVLRMASAREMPPPKAKRPAEVERQGFVAALAKEIDGTTGRDTNTGTPATAAHSASASATAFYLKGHSKRAVTS
jgi:hypothetical protein